LDGWVEGIGSNGGAVLGGTGGIGIRTRSLTVKLKVKVEEPVNAIY